MVTRWGRARDGVRSAFFERWFARVSAHRASGERRASSYMNGFARLEIAI